MKNLRATFKAFTLIEVLVIVAVILLLVLVLLPGLARSKMQSKQISCTRNLQLVGLAFKTWTVDSTARFPHQVPTAQGGVMETASNDLALVFQTMSNEE